MRDTVSATGFVLSAQPQGESDKRLVLLTRELGKITVFARGARRQGSAYLAACNPFVYATFLMYEGRSAYTLAGVQDAVYFTEIAACDPGVYYGYYFLETAGWYGQENLEAGDMVNLLYASLRAILKDVIPLKLIRRVYECRLLTVNGEFALPEGLSEDDPVRYALEYTMKAGYSSLFAFALKEEAFARYEKIVSSEMRRRAGVNFRALAILESIDANSGILYNLRDEKDG